MKISKERLLHEAVQGMLFLDKANNSALPPTKTKRIKNEEKKELAKKSINYAGVAGYKMEVKKRFNYLKEKLH